MIYYIEKMFTNIFKRFSIQAILVSFFLSFSFNLLNLYLRAAGILYSGIIYHSLILTLNVILFIIIIYFSESKRLKINFGASHLLSFPICILLLYQGDGSNLNGQKLTIGLLLLLAGNIFSKEFNQEYKAKDLFNLGMIFTIISFINIYLSLFFISIIFLIPQIIEKQKALISLFLGCFSSLSILVTLTYYYTGQLFYTRPEILNSNFTFENKKMFSEAFWIFIVIVMMIYSLVKFNDKGKRSNANNEKIFMLFWLIISIVFRVFNLYQDSTLWLLSFIPSAYLLGNLFERFEKQINREVLFYSLFIFGIISKIF